MQGGNSSSYIPIQSTPSNRLIDTAGNVITKIPLPSGGAFVTQGDSTIFWATSVSQRDTINDSIYVYFRLTKYTATLDSIWSRVIRVLLDGPYATGISQPLVPDRQGGIFYINSTFDNNNFLRTRIYHVDSLGNSVWPIGQVYLPGLLTRGAFHDGNGGIVLLLGNNYDRAARFDYHGNSLWPSAPITVISDPENLGPIRAGGDNRGGAIIPFWSLSGGIKAQHTGRNGLVGIITRVEDGKELPSSFVLYQNYPNPFNPKTVIKFQVSSSKLMELRVFDILGREVATLVNKLMHPGTYEVLWDASAVSSGVYYCRLQIDKGENLTRKMVLVR